VNGLSLTLLKTACIGTFLIGLVAAAASVPALAGPWNLLLDAVRWPLDGLQSAASDEARLLSAIGGGLTCGWAVMLYGLAAGPIARGDADASRLFVTGVLTWFTIDSLASAAAGWPGNIALNLVFAALLLTPFLLGGSAKPDTALA
jgi:hypothetical protein